MVLLAAVLGVGLLVLYWRLPKLLEQGIIDTLTGHGLRESRIEVTSVGFHRAEFSDLRTTADAWQLELELGRARYRPLEVVRARIESIELDGLRLQWAVVPAISPTPTTPTPPTPLLAGLPSHPPLRSLTVSNGVLALRGVRHTQILPFTAHLIADHDTATIDGFGTIRSATDRVRIEGRLDPRGHSRLSGAFNLLDPAAWLGLLPAWPAPADPDPIQWGPWGGTFGIHIPPGATEASVTVSLEPLQLDWPAGRITTSRVRAHSRVRATGLPKLQLHSGLESIWNSGLLLATPEVSVELQELTRLSASARDLRIQHGEQMQLKGDFLLTVEDAHDGLDAAGTLTFQLGNTQLPGLTLEPFHGEVRGNRNGFRFKIPELIVPFQGRWRLAEVTGEVLDPLAPDARALVRGYVDGAWSTNLLVPAPLPFELNAQHGPDGLIASVGIALDRVAIPALAGPDAARLAGNVALTAELKGDHRQFHARLALGLPQIEWAGGTVSDARLTGAIGVQSDATSALTLPAWVTRLLELWSGWSSGQFETAGLDLELSAGGISLAHGLTVIKPVLRFKRAVADTLNPARWAELELGVDAIAWNGIQMTNLGCSMFIDEEKLQLEGTVLWLGNRCPFSIELRPDIPHSGEVKLTGQFTVGPVNLREVHWPQQLTGGHQITVTGSAALQGDLSLHSDAPPELNARLDLELAKVDWPGHKLSLENVRTTVTWSAAEPWLPSVPEGLIADRLTWAGQELTGLNARIELASDQRAQFELVEAQWLGGRLRVAPFTWDLGTGDLGLELRMTRLDLAELGRQIPKFAGTLEGRIDGRIPIVRKAGRWQISAARLELDRQVRAHLSYPAEGLLTGGLSPGSPRYRQLEMAEAGLKDLRLQNLTADFDVFATPQPMLRLRLEGLSTSPRAIVPILVSLNLHGDFAELLALLHTAPFELPF